MQVIAIAIVSSNRVIGDGTKQPFEFAEDWARFKKVTLGHPMIMGRKTQDAIGRWLPGRTTIIVTSRPESIELPTDPKTPAFAVGSLAVALELAASLDEVVYVAGGGTVYEQAWPWLTDLDLTEVHALAEGAVRFPEIDPAEWAEVSREPRGEFDFVHYRRR